MQSPLAGGNDNNATSGDYITKLNDVVDGEHGYDGDGAGGRSVAISIDEGRGSGGSGTGRLAGSDRDYGAAAASSKVVRILYPTTHPGAR